VGYAFDGGWQSPERRQSAAGGGAERPQDAWRAGDEAEQAQQFDARFPQEL
jgi:hypothetical protein